MRPYPEIAANWAEAGITADKWVAFYCGTGWRASETWFYAYLQDWQRIAVYDGGWFEWSQDPANNPIEIGIPDAPSQDAARRHHRLRCRRNARACVVTHGRCARGYRDGTRRSYAHLVIHPVVHIGSEQLAIVGSFEFSFVRRGSRRSRA